MSLYALYTVATYCIHCTSLAIYTIYIIISAYCTLITVYTLYIYKYRCTLYIGYRICRLPRERKLEFNAELRNRGWVGECV